MNTIQKYAYYLQYISIAATTAICIVTFLHWFLDIAIFSSLVPDLYVKASYTFDEGVWLQKLSTIPWLHRILGLAVDSIALGLLCMGAISLNRIMKQLQAGYLFSAQIIALLHLLSKFALYWALYSPMRDMLLSIITTLHKGPGNRVLSISFGTPDIINIFIFSFLVLITALMQEAASLQKEQDLTI